MSELVMVQNNQVVVSSRQVAEHFGKRHDKLYSEIKRMYAEFISVGEGNAQNGGDPLFYEAEYIHPQNKQRYREYLMKRDGFTLLAMSFTGKPALEWKLKYIQAFNEMEKKLAGPILPDFSNPAVAARAWADEYEAKLLAQAEVKVLQPKARYYDLILNNKEVLPITVIAKDYGMTAQQLNTKLAELGVQYKRGKIWYLYDQYAGEGYTQARTYQNDEMDISATRTYWTQKGRRFIYDMLREEGILPLIEVA